MCFSCSRNSQRKLNKHRVAPFIGPNVLQLDLEITNSFSSVSLLSAKLEELIELEVDVSFKTDHLLLLYAFLIWF